MRFIVLFPLVVVIPLAWHSKAASEEFTEFGVYPFSGLVHTSMDVSSQGGLLAFVGNRVERTGKEERWINELKLWETAGGRLLSTTETGDVLPLVGVAFSPTPQRVSNETVRTSRSARLDDRTLLLATLSTNGIVRLWEIQPYDRVSLKRRGHWRPPALKAVTTLDADAGFGAADQALLRAGAERRVLELMAGKIGGFPHQRTIAFSPDGKLLAAVGTSKFEVEGREKGIGPDWVLRVWETETGALVQTFELDFGRVYCVAFSPDSRSLAVTHRRNLSGHGDSEVVFWDLSTGEQTRSLTIPKSFSLPNFMIFSPDGNTIITAGSGATVVEWDIARGEPRVTFQGHDSTVFCATLSPDGNTLATGGRRRGRDYQGQFFLWDRATGKAKASRSVKDCEVIDLGFLPDGERLAAFHRTIGVYQISDLFAKPLLDAR